MRRGQRDTRVSCLTKARANDSSTDAQGEPGIHLCAHLVCSDWWMRDKEGPKAPSTVTRTFTQHPTEQTHRAVNANCPGTEDTCPQL